MQDHSADELNVEMDHFPGRRLIADRKGVLAIGKTASALLYHRERFGQNFLQARLESAGVGDRRKLLFPSGGLASQIVVRKLTQRLFDLIDLIDKRLDAAQLALIFRADDGLENPIEHESDSKINNSRRD